MSRAAYLALSADGGLARRAEAALARLSSCVLCARRCGADRAVGGGKAACRTGRLATVARWGAESDGGGTIFFAGCNLRCLYCPTAAASWDGAGEEVTAERLAAIMLALQERGCRIIALVNPSHVAAQVVEAVAIAAARGLRLPLAWRSGGYDSSEALALLDGIVDLYLPAVKFGDAMVGRMLAGVRDYVAVNRAAVAEMHRQAGDLCRDGDGLPRRGLLVRHQVLPHGLAGTAQALSTLPPGTAVAVEGDYRPDHRARQHPRLARLVTADEVAAARRIVRELGLVEASWA